MANLITWWGLLEQARSTAFVTLPGPLDTPQNALIVLTRARRELQDHTNAVKRTATLMIDGTAADGGYAEPLDIKQPLEAQFTPANQTKVFDMLPLPPEMLDAIKRGAQWNAGVPIQPPFLPMKWYYTLDGGKVFIYPFKNVSGTFWTRYLPYLAEFQPSNLVGDFTGIDLNALQAWMQANGPDREFWASAGYMADYLAIDLMQKYNVHKAYPEKFAELHANWQQAKYYAVKNTLQQSKGIRAPRRMGVLK